MLLPRVEKPLNHCKYGFSVFLATQWFEDAGTGYSKKPQPHSILGALSVKVYFGIICYLNSPDGSVWIGILIAAPSWNVWCLLDWASLSALKILTLVASLMAFWVLWGTNPTVLARHLCSGEGRQVMAPGDQRCQSHQGALQIPLWELIHRYSPEQIASQSHLCNLRDVSKAEAN